MQRRLFETTKVYDYAVDSVVMRKHKFLEMFPLCSIQTVMTD